ncbi:MAG: hypothetical protein WC528_00280 [Patescibacteria group bacterium]
MVATPYIKRFTSKNLKAAIGNIVTPSGGGELTKYKFDKLIKNIKKSDPAALEKHQATLNSIAKGHTKSFTRAYSKQFMEDFAKAVRKAPSGYVLTESGKNYLGRGIDKSFKAVADKPAIEEKMGMGPTREELAVQKAHEAKIEKLRGLKEAARHRLNVYYQAEAIRKEQGDPLGNRTSESLVGPGATGEKPMTSISEIDKDKSSVGQSSSKNQNGSSPKNSSAHLASGSFGGAGSSVPAAPLEGGNAFYGVSAGDPGSGTGEKTSDGHIKDENQTPPDDSKPAASGDKDLAEKADEDKSKEADKTSPEPEKSESKEPPTSGLFE